MITNPIFYPGNKTKLIKQINPLIDSKGSKFVDIFCGSGMVAVNSSYKHIICNDISKEAIDLLKYLYANDSKRIIDNTEKIIKQYRLTYSKNAPKGKYIEKKHEGLSLYNKKGFNLLKTHYNSSRKIEELFVLLIYGFNHYIRFNSKGEYNVPVGKVDFSTSIYKHTIEFADGIKEKQINFYNYDFRNKKLYTDKNAIYYFDPPYLITQAPYNISWSEKDEKDLLNILDYLDKRGSKFILSNVILSNGKENTILKKWAKKYNVVQMKRQYRNASYHKKNITDTIEVVIKNY